MSRDSTLSRRPADEADVQRLTALLDACTRAYLDRPTSSAEVLDRLGTPGCTPGSDTSVVLAGDGTAVGFANIWDAGAGEVRGFARVHPRWRGQGVGTGLAAWMLGRAAEKAREIGPAHPRFTTTAWGADRAASSVLQAAGLAPVRHFLHLSKDLEALLPAPGAPAGITVRPYVEGVDDAALFECFTDAFAAHWGQAAPDATRWWWDERDSPDSGYDPALWLLAEAGEALAGFALGRVLPGGNEGYVSQLGVSPAYRGRGLGRVLLGSLLAAFSGRGLRSASLDVDVDNTTSALALYRQAGMTEKPAFTIWGCPLPV